MPSAHGKIVEFDGSRGTVRLDDGARLVFFRFSCSFEPAEGMGVWVWETAPFHEGGLRATALSDSPRAKAAPGDYARAVEAATAAKLKDDARRAARREKQLKAEAERKRRFVARNPALRRPAFSTLLPTRWPAAARALVKRSEAAARSAVELEFFDPGTVPLGSGQSLHIGLVEHPELAPQLVCWERSDDVKAPGLELVGLLPLAKAKPVMQILREANAAELSEADQQLRARFGPPSADFTARGDQALLLRWGRSSGAKALAAGKKLLAFYEAKGWKVLARRLEWQLRRDDYWRRYTLAVRGR